MLERSVMLRAISTIAGTMKVEHAVPSIIPVTKREVKLFSQIPKTPSVQSMPIGTSERNSQILDIGSVSSIRRHNG